MVNSTLESGRKSRTRMSGADHPAMNPCLIKVRLIAISPGTVLYKLQPGRTLREYLG